MFFLVRWKKGETHCVGVSSLQHIHLAIAYIVCLASVL
jgi:hypothetical protein